MENERIPKLVVKNLSKSFDIVKAVQDVSLEIHAGEVRGLIGENGSGKSTLSAMITGSLRPDGGSMLFNGKPYSPKSLIDARSQGIAILLQERGTLNGITVAENMFIGMEDRFKGAFGVSRKRMQNEAKNILAAIGVHHIHPADFVDRYSFEDRKLVEVARALYTNPEILIVDETTSALSSTGRDYIYKIIRRFKEEGKSVIFIGHNLEEVIEVCDTATVLKDGVYVDTLSGSDMEVNRMRSLMIGREMMAHYYREDYAPDYDEEAVVLEASGINLPPVINDVSLQLHRREILGICGLSDSGMHEIAKAIFGACTLDTGSVTLTQRGKRITSTHGAVEAKVAYLPKDRDSESLFLPTNIRDNISSTCFSQKAVAGLINKKHLNRVAKEQAEALKLKCSSVDQLAMELSGGNKQKVVIAKWLANQSDILIMDCPTRGIDIGVKAAIYDLMRQMKAEGKSIILLSEEMSEVIGMADRILTVKNGAVTAEFMRSKDLSESVLIEKII
ncbi:MAG: sugar ABC transporter ATP-binding protein [Clostridia bacterium]|nr:sugar ABC transporter ATP-binding protein [Clostridia bacterium]